jgi:DNA-binding response OmpR family regulator
MPHKDGITLVRVLRQKNILSPVIFLTARDDVEDKVLGLDAGVDDYLTKPFSITDHRAGHRRAARRVERVLEHRAARQRRAGHGHGRARQFQQILPRAGPALSRRNLNSWFSALRLPAQRR